MVFFTQRIRVFIVAASVFCFLTPSGISFTASTTNLDELLKEKRYLELKQALSKDADFSPPDRAFFEGVMANRQNRVGESIRLLRRLIPLLAKASKERAIVALGTLADDYEKSFRYADAADTYAELNRQFAPYMSDQQRQRAGNEATRWNLLRRAPPQTVEVHEPFKVPTTRDAIGLPEVGLLINKHRVSMILDTGANLCTISRSSAAKLGLKLSRAQATTRGITGALIAVQTTVISEIRFGGATFRNVAFMVIDDEDLNFPQLHYRIPGSLGFPVLSALGRITFFSNGEFGVDRQGSATSERANLFLERLTPVVTARIGDAEHLFTIDTGATGSFLSAQYYREHKSEFEEQPGGDMDLMGAGGSKEIPVYFMRDVSVVFGGGCVRLSELPVLTQPRGITDDRFYGNFGQSVLNQLQSYTFDFRAMNFSIETTICRESAATAH